MGFFIGWDYLWLKERNLVFKEWLLPEIVQIIVGSFTKLRFAPNSLFLYWIGVLKSTKNRFKYFFVIGNSLYQVVLVLVLMC